MKKLKYILLALILISAILFSSCIFTNQTSTTVERSNDILYLESTDPLSLDPAISSDIGSAEYIIQIFSGLLRLNDNLEPEPDIAASLPEVSADGLTYTFKLRQDVKFQDGKAVTAKDFKYSWERAANPATKSQTTSFYLNDIVGVNEMLAGQANEISGVKVIDDYTLQVTIDAPKSYFLYKMTYPITYVVEKSNVESGANWWHKPIGTGAFKLKEWTQEKSLILERNENYYGEKAKVKQVQFTFNSTSSTMDLYETDQIDITGVPTAYYYKVMDKSQPFYSDLKVSPSLSIDYIGFNCSEPPFDDINIRQAFSMAIDKDKIISLVYENMGQKAEGILPPGMPGYNQNLKGLEYNVEKAKELIKASKYGDVSKLPQITLTVAGEGGSISSLIEALVYQWKENLGVEVKVRQLELELFYNHLGEEVDQMYYYGWIADYPHPQDFLDILFTTGTNNNHGSYSNAEVDSLIQQANHELDQEKSLALYQQAEQKIVDDAACLPIQFGEDYLLIQPYVQGFNENALGFIYYNRVSLSSH